MTKKKNLIVVLALLLVIVGLVFVLIWPVRDNWRQQYLYHKILGEFSALENAYKNDTYGGRTPEETLEIFIVALQKGDVDLASKYFVLEKRQKIKSDMMIAKEKGNINLLLNDLKKEMKKSCSDFSEECQFVTFDNNNVAEFSYSLRKNEYNNKWLIESL